MTPEEHDAALAEIDRLMHLDLGPIDAAELDDLARRVEEYEKHAAARLPELRTTLRNEEGWPVALVEITKLEDHYADVAGFLVDSHDPDTLEPIDVDELFTGFIKWDGCANYQLGDGYFHFCDAERISLVSQAMRAAYDLAAANIKEFRQ